jgi:ectoine hydroxylase-related dioxygenase (phytanoyl-CoA dioxygenase family)
MDPKLTNLSLRDGYCVLPQVFDKAEIEAFRQAAVDNLGSMGQTRNVAHSYHLAGFHRFPALAAVHARIAADETINRFLQAYYQDIPYFALGLSDITVNRSQHWHTDLLRGRYSGFLKDCDPWAETAGCLKALVYLQDGASLRILPGSHLTPTPLDDTRLETLAEASAEDVVRIDVRAGDVVMMDIRALHRGSTDADMASAELGARPKILVSTVFGGVGSAFSQAMQIGNAHRMADWDRRYLA